nr:hypothetical protein GCM10020185_80470 [Pseudomonas brassicacearum subsp. brassicacearum]
MNIQWVIHTGGPFQGQSYAVAESCIDAGVNYCDLSDSRDFVTGIGALDARAKTSRRGDPQWLQLSADALGRTH